MASRKTAKRSATGKTATRTRSGSKRAKAVAKATARRGRAVAEVIDEGPPAPAGSTSLVIVESPAKAKTIGKYLGRGYRVRATVGHIMDLPEKKLGIDVEKGFTPELVPIPGKEKTIAELKSAAKDSREVLIATDPDREVKRSRRTLRADQAEARIRHGAIRVSLSRDHQGRGAARHSGRGLHRLEEGRSAAGARVCSIVWWATRRVPSLEDGEERVVGGRVQTVALRLIVEREREIRAFKPVEYWTIEALLEKDGQQFTAKLHHIDGKKARIRNERKRSASSTI
jgi:DNA topoisomerase-1